MQSVTPILGPVPNREPVRSRHPFMLLSSCLVAFVISSLSAAAQYTQDAPVSPQQQAPAQNPQGQTTPDQTTPPPPKTPDQTVPDNGGPADTDGPIAIPKKNPEDNPPPPPPPSEPKVKNPAGLENYSLRVDVPMVNVDVGVLLEKTHQFVPNLKEDNFRLYEDGVPQKLVAFNRIQAPITAVLLCEFASTSYNFVYDMRSAAFAFAQRLRPQDYVAVMTYDMHTQILTDFTQDKRVVMQALNTLMIPGFSETNEFDALYETLDRVSRIDGRKYIILVSSGIDSFSKINLDKIMQKIKATPNVTIFTIATGNASNMRGGSMGGLGRGVFAPKGIDYLQGYNELTTFARMTGGQFFRPQFETEMPDIFDQINASIRNQYVLSYTPTNPRQDGTYRKIRIELVDGEGKPLQMQDEKHHNLKYDIVARDGYRAKQQVE